MRFSLVEGLIFNTYRVLGKKDGEEVSRVEMFIKTRQGRPCRNEKAMDKETLDTIVSLF